MQLSQFFCRVVPFVQVKAVAISTCLAVLRCHKAARCQQAQLRPAAAELSPALPPESCLCYRGRLTAAMLSFHCTRQGRVWRCATLDLGGPG